MHILMIKRNIDLLFLKCFLFLHHLFLLQRFFSSCHQLNWLSSCRATPRSQAYIVLDFLPSEVFIFFFSRTASLFFFLSSSAVDVYGNCWAPNVGVNDRCMCCNEVRVWTIESSWFISVILYKVNQYKYEGWAYILT